MRYWLTLTLLQPFWLFCQSDTILVAKVGEFEYSNLNYGYSSVIDKNGAPFIYTASNHLGLVVFDISDLSSPVPVDTLPTATFNNKQVTNLHQQDHLLYLSLGGFQGDSNQVGLAILDVQNPSSISVTSVWDTTVYWSGSAIVRVADEVAFLGMMEEGILTLDVSNPSAPHTIGHYVPDLSWPGVVNYSPNARGMEVRNDTLFLAFDAGGLRLVDVSDPSNPEQIAQYINFDLTDIAAPAYNNVVLKGRYAFITVDYCGLEVVDISDPNNLQNVGWYNPWNCFGLSWFGSDGHSNELIIVEDSLLFMSGAESEVLVINVAEPSEPTPVGEYVLMDSAATWGIDVRNDLIVCTFIDNSIIPILQPYYSEFGGIQVYNWAVGSSDIATPIQQSMGMLVWSTPGTIEVSLLMDRPDNLVFRLFDLHGRKVMQRKIYAAHPGEQRITFPTAEIASGMYLLEASGARSRISKPLLLQ